MSDSSLPNLLQSRGGRGNRPFRRGRARGSSRPGDATGHDETIQGTDNDAAVSRLSAVELGYISDDPFAQYFVQAAPGPSSRRLPIINRGTYTRTTALDTLIGMFLSGTSYQGPQPRQIISLGAGTDTRPFRLFARQKQNQVVYHELDFAAMAAKKLRTVRAVPALRAILPNASDPENDSWGARPPSGGEYLCHGVDLRRLAQSDAPSTLPGLRTDVPTLLVSECCLCYLEPAEAQGVISWFAHRIADVGIVLYEPVKPDDPFGKMMVSNLAARRIRMPTLEMYKQPDDQASRLRDAGFEFANAVTVDEIYETWISDEERERVDRLEGLDEVEEWKLLAGHYAVAWGWRGNGFTQFEGFPDRLRK